MLHDCIKADRRKVHGRCELGVLSRTRSSRREDCRRYKFCFATKVLVDDDPPMQLSVGLLFHAVAVVITAAAPVVSTGRAKEYKNEHPHVGHSQARGIFLRPLLAALPLVIVCSALVIVKDTSVVPPARAPSTVSERWIPPKSMRKCGPRNIYPKNCRKAHAPSS